MLLNRLGDGAEDDAGLLQLVLEGGGDGDAVEHRIDSHVAGLGHAGQCFLLVQGNAQLLIGAQQFRIHLVQGLGAVLQALGGGVVGDGLEVDGRKMHMRPLRWRHLPPNTVGGEAPIRHPSRFPLSFRDVVHHGFVQAGREGVRLHFGGEAGAVFLIDEV